MKNSDQSFLYGQIWVAAWWLRLDMQSWLFGVMCVFACACYFFFSLRGE